MTNVPTLEDAARRAVDGDREAVASVVRGIEGAVYALALRTLWHREDAEDATQEILVRVVTRLAQFDFKSRLLTWVYRVATNYLLDVKKSCAERQKLSFTSFGEDLALGLTDDGPADAEATLLTEEVKIGCTLGMLLCLDRPHRIAYVLGEILELSAPEAADAMDLEPAAFRKRLQRAREAIETFTRAHCGLVADAAPCKCNQRVGVAIQLGRVRPDALEFAQQPSSFASARALIHRAEHAKRVLELHRTAAPKASVRHFAELVVSALDSATGPGIPKAN
jgi:RNA polymerase sigma factor (sigma-70 family)